jgi:hypothetical protein
MRSASGDKALQDMINHADVMADTGRTYEVVASRNGALPFITVDFQTEPQSTEYLQRKIHGYIVDATPSRQYGTAQGDDVDNFSCTQGMPM